MSFVDPMHTQTKITVNILVKIFVDTHRTTFESNLCDGGDLRLTCQTSDSNRNTIAHEWFVFLKSSGRLRMNSLSDKGEVR